MKFTAVAALMAVCVGQEIVDFQNDDDYYKDSVYKVLNRPTDVLGSPSESLVRGRSSRTSRRSAGSSRRSSGTSSRSSTYRSPASSSYRSP